MGWAPHTVGPTSCEGVVYICCTLGVQLSLFFPTSINSNQGDDVADIVETKTFVKQKTPKSRCISLHTFTACLIFKLSFFPSKHSPRNIPMRRHHHHHQTSLPHLKTIKPTIVIALLLHSSHPSTSDHINGYQASHYFSIPSFTHNLH
jgi:hypothetical protein